MTGTAEAPQPGPELTALVGVAVANLGGELDEGQLLGASSAARRLKA